jgi:uncharacterized lipoprotein YehR (DUF1307 family)
MNENENLINQNILRKYIQDNIKDETEKLREELNLAYKKIALLEERIKILEDRSGIREIMSEWAMEDEKI